MMVRNRHLLGLNTLGSGDRSDLRDGNSCGEDSVELVDELHFGFLIPLA